MKRLIMFATLIVASLGLAGFAAADTGSRAATRHRSCARNCHAALQCELLDRHDAEHTADRPVHLGQP